MAQEQVNPVLAVFEKIQQLRFFEKDIERDLTEIMSWVAGALKAESAFVFVSVEENSLAEFCRFGKEGKLSSVRCGEGFVGKIAQSCLILSENKPEDFALSVVLGAPMLQWNKPIGVLVVGWEKEHAVTQDEKQMLEFFVMILTNLFAVQSIAEYKVRFIKGLGLSVLNRLKGVVINKGFGVGEAVVHERRQDIKQIFNENKDLEKKRLSEALKNMAGDFEQKLTAQKFGIGEQADILETYKMFAEDKGWHGKIDFYIDTGLTAEAAVEKAYDDMWNKLSLASDLYLKERLEDLRNVSDRLQLFLAGNHAKKKKYDSDIVLIAQSMGPADLMDYDYKKIRALVLEEGTPTMHVSIVAKALNIPVIAKIKGVYKDIQDGQMIAVDGSEGFVYLNPGDDIVQSFKQKQKSLDDILAELKDLKKVPSKTLDGERVDLNLNVGLDLDMDYISATNCDGIGLYRTEILFMSSDKMISKQKEVAAYEKILNKANKKKVIFRSLDVGSDKLLPYWGSMKEENPAIGWRSIRITLDRRALLRRQMKAFLEAAEGKELYVMFPMIASLEEFVAAKETLLIEWQKQKNKGLKGPVKLNIGLMIEVPSVVLQLDEILNEADFISVGTNDLAQFFFACDRTNPRIMDRYDVLSAPFLRLMKIIVDKARTKGVPCSVCGEMASSPVEALALLGLGYRSFSATGASFAGLKKMILSANTEDVADYMRALLGSYKNSVRPQLLSYAEDHAIAI